MNWKQRGEAAVASPSMSDGEKGRQLLALVNERLDLEGVRLQAWGAMRYACDRGCGFEAWYELEMGVEGPPIWKEDGTTIACPLLADRCLRCAGTMKHVDFPGDVTFKRPMPLHSPFLTDRGIVQVKASQVFRVPREPVRSPTHLLTNGKVSYSEATHAFLMANVKGGRSPRF